MTGCGLRVFDALCRCGNEVEALRDCCRAGSDAWTALTQVLQAVDMIVDAVVHSTGLDEEDSTDVES